MADLFRKPEPHPNCNLAMVAISLPVALGLAMLLVAPVASTQELKKPPIRPDNDVWSIVLSKDGKIVVGSSGWWTEPGEIGVWNLETRTPLKRFSQDLGVASVALSNNGKLLASGGWTGHVRVYDWAANKELADFDNVGVARVAFSQDDKLLASAAERATVKLWDMTKFVHLADLKGDLVRFLCVTFSPDGKQVLAGGGDWKPGGVCHVAIWDVETKEQVLKLVGHDLAVVCMTYSPDGNIIATGAVDKTIRLWDAKTGKHLKTLAGHTHWVETLVYTADGKTLISGSHDHTIRFWDVERGIEKAGRITMPGSVRILLLTPDEKSLLVGGSPKLLKIIDPATRAELGTLWNDDEPAKIARLDKVPVVVAPKQKIAMDELPIANPEKPPNTRVWLIVGVIVMIAIAGLVMAVVAVRFFLLRQSD